MPPAPIPFLKPSLPDWRLVGEELKDAYASGRFHPGKYVERAEAAFRDVLRVKHALLLSTCADGLILLAAKVHRDFTTGQRAKDLGRGPPVIAVPAFTFRATPQAVWWGKCEVAVVDVLPDGNMDPASLAKARADVPNLAAVMPVHVFGRTCPVTPLRKAVPDLPILYDAAHALGTRVNGAPMGALGDAQVFSLNITKAIPSAGEGGLLVTDDDAITDWILKARWHGDMPGSLDWKLPGMNAKPTEWQGIVAFHALQRMNTVHSRRQGVVRAYLNLLECAPAFESRIVVVDGKEERCTCDGFARKVDGTITGTLPIEERCKVHTAFWPMQRFAGESIQKDFAVRFATAELRAAAETRLRADHIEFKRYFHPVVSQMSDFSGYVVGDTVARELADTVLCLPVWIGITEEDQRRVVDAVKGS